MKDKSEYTPKPAKKGSASKVGAPAQHNQAHRKGKKAWRKNVDLEDIEENLEGLREEERTYGTTLHEKKDGDLFVVDKIGDDKIRRLLPKFSTRALTAHKVLSQRSAVPAVFSRPSASASRRSNITRKEKERLLQIAKKNRKGPLNCTVDHSQFGEGSALMEVSNAVEQSGKYDVWARNDPFERLSIKPPNVPRLQSQIELPAVAVPHGGASYNPDAAAHTELLQNAIEIEERRTREKEALEAVKERILLARRTGVDGVASMTVDSLEDLPDSDQEITEATARKMPGHKTKQQRRRAERLQAEKRMLAERALRKRLNASVDSAKRLGKALNESLAQRARKQAERSERAKQRLRAGLAGQRLGKHRVPESEISVQLGDELSESLRNLAPEGNLFRDRFLSLQHRALIEPRAPVVPTKRAKMKIYEKHDFKRFE